ncbi:MAG: hypothetical protein IKG23_13015 [Clostridia bacterium]|nr:hypothetical protein [Clostridia bacterium]
MDFGSNTFLIITIAMFAIAAFAFVQGIVPLGILFALFGVGGLLVRYTVKKKK